MEFPIFTPPELSGACAIDPSTPRSAPGSAPTDPLKTSDQARGALPSSPSTRTGCIPWPLLAQQWSPPRLWQYRERHYRQPRTHARTCRQRSAQLLLHSRRQSEDLTARLRSWRRSLRVEFLPPGPDGAFAPCAPASTAPPLVARSKPLRIAEQRWSVTKGEDQSRHLQSPLQPH